MKKQKVSIAITILICLLVFNSTNVNAQIGDNPMLAVQQFVLEIPKDFPTTSSWTHNSITSITSLYDFNDTISAYV